MGNKMSPGCVPHQTGTSVKVYHGDNGQLMKFSGPTPAVKLMRDHPNYLLVYSVVKARRAPTSAKAVKGRVPQQCVRIRVVLPGDLLYAGQVYFLVHIPDQYRAKLAKYFDLSQLRSSSAASPRSRYSSPPASPLPCESPPYSTTRSPQSARRSISSPGSFLTATSSPLASPLRSPLPKYSYSPSPLSGSTKERRVATPLSTYIGRPLSGSTCETTNVANRQHLQRKLAQSKGNRTPERPSTHSIEVTFGSILKQDKHQNPNTLGDTINQGLQPNPQPNPNGSLRSPGRGVLPRTQDTLKSLLYQNLQQRNAADALVGSPGRAIAPTEVTTRVTQRPKGGSPHHTKSNPRRPVKSVPGKPDLRHRRGGMRSPSHCKAASLISPRRSTDARVAVTMEAVIVSSKIQLKCRESATRTKSRGANEAAAPAAVPGPVGNTVSPRKAHRPRLTRSRATRSASWAPGLGSISETEVSESSDVEDLIASRYHRLHPGYLRPRIR